MIKMMSREQVWQLSDIISVEGFDVTITNFNHVQNQIEDETYQLLRKQYVEASTRLKEYIDVCAETHGLGKIRFRSLN